MSWRLYGILILFGLFVLLLIFSPNLSCFGRTIRSPLYPLLRKKKQRRIPAEDYGFRLVEKREEEKTERAKKSFKETKQIKTQDYGFNLTEEKEDTPSEGQERKR